MRGTGLMIVLALLLLPSRPGEVPSRPAAADAPELRAVMRQVHFAWRLEDGVWRSRHTTWEAAVEASGALEFVPAHFAADGERVMGAAVRLGPSSITLGGQPVSSSAPAMRGTAGGGLAIDRGAFEEEFESGEAGVEQRWRFARRPAGTGELRVFIPTGVTAAVATTIGGLHFKAGGLGVRYGHGTWIDAAGRRVAIPAAHRRGGVEFVVPLHTLDETSWPAVLDPLVTAELEADQPVSGPAFGAQRFPEVACLPGTCLVVWDDHRIDRYQPAVFGTRVTPTGAILDPTGFQVSPPGQRAVRPAVSTSGQDFLVAWPADYPGRELFSRRVSANGVLLEPQPRRLAQTRGRFSAPAVASTSAGSLVAWLDIDIDLGTAETLVMRVDPSGTPLDAAPLRIGATATGNSRPRVACEGTHCLVVWAATAGGLSRIDAALVQVSGAALMATDVVVRSGPPYTATPAVGWAGTQYVVTWVSGGALSAARVDAAGQVLDSSPIVVAPTAARPEPSVACFGGECLFAWSDARSSSSLSVARLSDAGVVLDAEGLVVAATGSTETPVVAHLGADWLVVWGSGLFASAEAWDVAGARVTPSGVVEPLPTLLSSGAVSQQAPSLTRGDGGYLLAWVDARTGRAWSLVATRLDVEGRVLDPAGLMVSPPEGDVRAPAAAWGGGDYLVVWDDGRSLDRSIYGARISAAGVVREPGGFPIANAFGREHSTPAVASNGSDFLVTWGQFSIQSRVEDLYGARVSAAGVVLDAPAFAVSTAPLGQSWPSIAWNGSTYLVAWTDFRAQNLDVYAARVTADGRVLDPAGVPLATSLEHEWSPVVSWDGSRHLVAWVERRGDDDQLGMTFVTPAGVPEFVRAPPSGPGVSAPVALAWDGEAYLAAWTDWRTHSSDVYRARISATGPFTPESLLAGSPHQEEGVTASCTSPGRCLVFWSGFDDRPDRNANRVQGTRLLEPTARSASVTTDEDVEVGFVLTGVDPADAGLTFRVVRPPTFGALRGTAPALTYVPAPDWSGTETLAFSAHDGRSTSLAAEVRFVVLPVNDPPTATPQRRFTEALTPVRILLSGEDVDGDALTFTIRSQPVHGALALELPWLTYTPAAGFVGADAFTFSASDGHLESSPATVALDVLPSSTDGGGQPGAGPVGCGCSSSPRADLLAGLGLLLSARRLRWLPGMRRPRFC